MSKIEWLATGDARGKTWNPIRARNVLTGKVGWFRLVEIYIDEATLQAPLHWKTPAKIFPCSMTDLYGEWVSAAWLDRVYEIMARTPQHFYIVLTKRSERRRQYMRGKAAFVNLPNVIEMASFGTQAEADVEVPALLNTPAALHGVSAEPLLEHLDLQAFMQPSFAVSGMRKNPSKEFLGALSTMTRIAYKHAGGALLSWAIIGGESGSKARPFNIDWGLSLVDQCKRAGCACFVKQVGSNPQWPNEYWNGLMPPKTDRKGGDMTQWPEALRVRQYPEAMEFNSKRG